MKQKLFLTLALLMTVCSFGMAQSKQAYAVLSNDGKTLTFHYDANKSTYDDDHVSGLNTYDQVPGWHKPYDDSGNNPNIVEKVIFEESFQDVRPESTYGWFLDQEQLTTIEGLEYLNTSKVENMKKMFQNCSKLKSLNLSTFNTSNVNFMSYMFDGCSNLERLNIRNFDTSKVSDMSYMFSNCSSLTNLLWNGFNTQKVEYMSSMFKGCASLPNLRLSFDASNVEDMTNMFSGCTKMNEIDLSEFVTSKVVDMSSMFKGCQSLQKLILGKNFKTTHVVGMYSMFEGCSSLPMLNLTNFETGNVDDMCFMFDGCSSLKRIYVGDGWNTENVPQFNKIFIGCTSLEGEKGTKQNDVHVDKLYAHIDGGESNPGYLSGRPSGYVVFDGDSLTFYNDGRMEEKTGTPYLSNIGTEEPEWLEHSSGIFKVVFDKSFATARPVSTYNWFGGFDKLAEIKGLQYLNTSEVTTMNAMFSGCSLITNLDLSHFNTSKVTNMATMFISCISLKEINLLSFDTSNVTTMGLMFSGCNSLETLNLGSFNTKKVTEMRLMFSSCGKLKTICVGENWSVDNEESNCWAMFGGCSNLVGEKGTKCDGSGGSHKEFAHIDGGEDDPGYLSTAPLIEAYAVYNDGTLTFYYDDQRSSRTGATYGMNGIGSYPGWYSEHRNDIKKVVFNSSFQNARPVSTSYWFAGDVDDEWNYTSQITTITDIQYLNTSNVVDMSCMFHFCSQLKTIDVTGFKTDNVTNMYSMFDGCESLTTLDVSKFKTDKVTNMIRMFCGCIYLEELDVSNWNTEKVTYMNSLFSYCSSLTTLDVSNWNTANVEDMGWTFEGCQKLTALDVSNWKTNNVTDMSGMFLECYQLETLDVSNWNTAKVTEMYAMFENTSNLTSLDLSSFDTRNVTNMSYMFCLDKKLTTIYVGNLWSVSN